MRIFVLSLFFLFGGTLIAQSPFHLDAKREWILLSAGVGIYSAGLIYEQKINPLSMDEILNLENNVNKFDAWALQQNSRSARLGSDIGLGLGNLAPILMIVSPQAKRDRALIAVMYLETMSLTLAATGWTKRLVLRPRPFNYDPAVALSEKMTRNARFSFFSGHTSTTAAACFFTAAVWSKYNQESKWKVPVWALAVTLPAVTGFLRVQSGKHFYTDVIAGYAVGAGMGVLIPWLHKSPPIFTGKFKMTIAPNLIHCKFDF